MDAKFDFRIIVVVDDSSLPKLEQLFDLCKGHDACQGWDAEGDTYAIYLQGPIEANEDLLAKIQAI